jgi:rhodanese-related sulfurtransferase
MKKFFLELGIIAMLSFALGMAYNHFQDSPLPVFEKYKPDAVQQAEEDFSSYYGEVDVETLRSLLEADMAVLLDARKAVEYNEAHIPQAISLPISEFEEKYPGVISLVPGDKSIIIYCTGLHCLDSSLLAKELYKKGQRELYVYKGGIEQWQELGYRIEPGEGAADEK